MYFLSRFNLHSCKIPGSETKARAQPACQASLLLTYWGLVEESSTEDEGRGGELWKKRGPAARGRGGDWY